MPSAAPKFYLRPDQEEAVEAIVAALQTSDRTQAIMACGTGKTFTGQRAAERLTKENPDALILVTVPNMVLVDQLMREWITQASEGFHFQAKPVVSEASSPATMAAAARRDETTTGFELLGNTTEPAELADFMLRRGRRIIFSTYQSSRQIASAVALAKERRCEFVLDLIVADEAHRTAGPGTKGEAGLFKTILDDTKIDAAKRLFMTATPRQSRVPKGEKDNAAFSMGNEAVYGRRAITRSLSWAVDNGHLAPYRAIIAQVSDADVEAVIRADKKLRVRGSAAVIAARATQIAAAIVLVKAAKQRSLGSVVTYHNSIARAREFQTVLEHVALTMPAGSKPAGTLRISHINGTTPAEERATYLATLDSKNRADGDWAVVTNCNCLTDGVNVPSMDAIMLVDPRSSTVGIVQAVGRPMRKDPARPEKVASILLPVFVGMHQTTAAAIEAGAFATVYDALQALKDVDDALSEMFVQERVDRASGQKWKPALEMAETGRPFIEVQSTGPVDSGQLDEVPQKVCPAAGQHIPLLRVSDHEGSRMDGQPADALITVMAPISHGKAGSATVKNHEDWHRAISIRILDDNATSWERGRAALRVYFEETGHAKVPAQHASPEGFKLGNWVLGRRQEFRAGKLDAECASDLEALHGWSWNTYDDDRRAALAALAAHVAETGHACVPGDYVSPDGYALGQWVIKRRMDLKKGKLAPDLVEELESFPGWVWSTYDKAFQAALANLREYFAENENIMVPRGYVRPDGMALGKWVSLRRHRMRAGMVPAEQIAALDAIDHSWRKGGLAPWESAPGILSNATLDAA